MTEEEIEIQNNEEEQGSVGQNIEIETLSHEELKVIEVQNQKFESETSSTAPNPVQDRQPENVNPAFSADYFTQIPNILVIDMREGKLQPLDVLVYAVLFSHKGQNNCCWAGNTLVANTVGTSVRNFGRCLDRLVKAGHIVRGGSTKMGTRFTYFKTRVENHGVIVRGQPAKSTKANEPVEPAPEVKDPLSELFPGTKSEPFDYANAKPVFEIKLEPRKPQTILEFLAS